MSLDIVPSVCPHDCPSACALEVERIDGRRIGRVHGARAQSYTRGVVCAKVARYAEREHHPDRLFRPLRRIGEKGIGKATFALISWVHALFGGGLYAWLWASLIVSAVYLLIGGLAGWLAYSEIKATKLTPTRTLKVLQQDQVWIQNEARTV